MPSVMSNLSDDLKNQALAYHRLSEARKARNRRHQAARQPARPGAGLFAGRGRGLRGDRGRSARGRRTDQPAESRGGGVQRHGGAGAWQYRTARLQAGDGRQGGPVQEIRRHRRVRHRDRGNRRRRAWSRWCAALEPTFGGINLEDIKAPECFEVEAQLKERMKIPVFHDDQHGTAIIVARRGSQRARIWRQEDRERQDRHLGRGCGRARLSQSSRLARREAREHLGHRSRRRGLQGPPEADGPLEGCLRAGHQQRERSARSSTAPMCSSASRPAAC